MDEFAGIKDLLLCCKLVKDFFSPLHFYTTVFAWPNRVALSAIRGNAPYPVAVILLLLAIYKMTSDKNFKSFFKNIF